MRSSSVFLTAVALVFGFLVAEVSAWPGFFGRSRDVHMDFPRIDFRALGASLNDRFQDVSYTLQSSLHLNQDVAMSAEDQSVINDLRTTFKHVRSKDFPEKEREFLETYANICTGFFHRANILWNPDQPVLKRLEQELSRTTPKDLAPGRKLFLLTLTKMINEYFEDDSIAVPNTVLAKILGPVARHEQKGPSRLN